MSHSWSLLAHAAQALGHFVCLCMSLSQVVQQSHRYPGQRIFCSGPRQPRIIRNVTQPASYVCSKCKSDVLSFFRQACLHHAPGLSHSLNVPSRFPPTLGQLCSASVHWSCISVSESLVPIEASNHRFGYLGQHSPQRQQLMRVEIADQCVGP